MDANTMEYTLAASMAANTRIEPPSNKRTEAGMTLSVCVRSIREF
jgi:hypothetical protein